MTPKSSLELNKATQRQRPLNDPPIMKQTQPQKNPRNSYRAAPDTVDAATSQQTNEVTRGQKGFTISR